MYKKFALMVFLATGALALQATAAMAGWKSFGNTNPITSTGGRWRCQTTVPLSNNVGAQVCTIRFPSTDDFPNGRIQGAVIVRNSTNYLFSTNASLTVYREHDRRIFGSASCSSSGVGANSWSVCFGSHFPSAYGTRYYTGGYANGRNLGTTWPN
jgi:hypothetical protein